jgi:hypothetical protein
VKNDKAYFFFGGGKAYLNFYVGECDVPKRLVVGQSNGSFWKSPSEKGKKLWVHPLTN